MNDHQTERIVWVIDSEHWPRACIRAELIERGLETDGYENIAEALIALGDPLIARPQLIVLELRDQPVLNECLQDLHKQDLPVIALGGAAELAGDTIKSFPWLRVMRRPFSIGELADIVQKFFANETRER